jgi:Hint domain
MSDHSNGLKNWRRTRRNVLAMGGVLAGATLSCISRASAAGWRGWHHHHHHPHGPSCYLKGTHILTTLGERKIEDLQIGDLVITAGGAKPIEWIGGRRYLRASGQGWAAAIKPVRVARGALGQDLPHADLFLSQEHRLLLDGGLIRVGDLVNGTSIAIDACADVMEIEYLHIKLSSHHAIYAEGAVAETLLFNPISLDAVDNLMEYERLYGPANAAEPACAPVYSDEVFGCWGRLQSHFRSALSPWNDRRGRFDRIRDRLCDRADALAA